METPVKPGAAVNKSQPALAHSRALRLELWRQRAAEDSPAPTVLGPLAKVLLEKSQWTEAKGGSGRQSRSPQVHHPQEFRITREDMGQSYTWQVTSMSRTAYPETYPALPHLLALILMPLHLIKLTFFVNVWCDFSLPVLSGALCGDKIEKQKEGDSMMVQCVRVLAAKPNNLHQIPPICMMERQI